MLSSAIYVSFQLHNVHAFRGWLSLVHSSTTGLCLLTQQPSSAVLFSLLHLFVCKDVWNDVCGHSGHTW